MVLILAQAAALFANGPLLAALGAAAIAVPILIHLFSRMRRTPEPWGAMRFLMQAYRKRRKRIRLEQWLLLLVRCAILLVLGLALAGPLLGGCAGRLTSGLDAGTGRTLVIVLDDALSTRAAQARGRTRFDALRAEALEAIAALRPGDRVAVVRAARPVDAVIPVPTADLERARQAVETMRPRSSRSELPRALAEVAASMRERPEAYGGSTAVLILSDFARSRDYLEEALPEAAAELGELARVVVTRPDAGAGNVQVRSVRPRRRVVLASAGTSGTGGGTGGVPVEATVRRFESAASAAEATLRLELLGGEGEVASIVERPVTFGAGQAEASVNAELPLPEQMARATSAGGEGGRVMVVRATLEPGGMADAVAADDVAWAVVEVRPGVTVQTLGGFQKPPDSLSANDWLSLALRPMDASPFGVASITDPEVVGEVEGEFIPGALHPDVIFVLEPDRLTGEGWAAVSEVVRGGGILWLTPPSTMQAGDDPAAWSQRMRAALGVDWTFGEVVSAGEGGGEGGEGGEAWPLDVASPTPEPLGILSADWEALLRPVRVRRMVEVNVEQGEGGEVWLRLSEGAIPDTEPDASSPPLSTPLSTPQRRREEGGGGLMVVEAVGAGSVVWLGVALDGEWTNLPTKPLLVPLVHETLRAMIGRGRGGEELVSGDQAVLGGGGGAGGGEEGEGVAAVRRVAGFGAGPGGAGTATEVAAPESESDSVEVGEGVLSEAGVYAAVTGDTSRRLAVNVDADAGDTREAGESAVEAWLDGLGAGRWSWLDATDTAAALETASQRTNLGWPLLWAVLGLVLVETLLARFMSHTPREQGGAATLLRRMGSVKR